MKKLQALILTLSICLFLTVSNAAAALTVDQQAVVTSIDTMVTDMTTVAWSLILGITGTLITIKVFKKFSNRAV